MREAIIGILSAGGIINDTVRDPLADTLAKLWDDTHVVEGGPAAKVSDQATADSARISQLESDLGAARAEADELRAELENANQAVQDAAARVLALEATGESTVEQQLDKLAADTAPEGVEAPDPATPVDVLPDDTTKA